MTRKRTQYEYITFHLFFNLDHFSPLKKKKSNIRSWKAASSEQQQLTSHLCYTQVCYYRAKSVWLTTVECLCSHWQCDHTEVLHAEGRMAWQSAANRQRADVTVGATEISSGRTTYSTFWTGHCWPSCTLQPIATYWQEKSPDATNKSHWVFLHRAEGGCCFFELPCSLLSSRGSKFSNALNW